MALRYILFVCLAIGGLGTITGETIARSSEPECQDKDSRCHTWAKQGHCHDPNVRYYCKRSCHRCPSCGVQSLETARIGNGEITEDIIPWQVAIVKKFPWMNEFTKAPQCGGTIICPRFVITAAHCVHELDPEPGYELDPMPDYQRPDLIQVLAEEHDWTNDYDKATTHRVKHIHIHENYNRAWLNYDYAIMELEDPIDLSSASNARAACLPNPEDIHFNKDTKFTVSGWGYIDIGLSPNVLGTHSEKLKHAIVDFCSPTDFEACPGCPMQSWKICSTSSRGDTSCSGDSGGPVTWVDPQSSQAVLIGIVSGGNGAECGSRSKITISARVSYVLDWIEEITGNCHGDIYTS